MDDGTITEFKKDQAVFVLPDPETLAVKTDTPPQEAYWLALVKDIRANSTGEPVLRCRPISSLLTLPSRPCDQ